MLYLKENQVKVLNDNGEITIILPLSQQPPEGYRCEGISIVDGTHSINCAVFTNNTHYDDPNHDQFSVKLQFPVGKSVKCRKQILSYRNAKTGRKGTVDTRTIVTSNRVCHVQKITPPEMKLCMGFDPCTLILDTDSKGFHPAQHFRDYFNSQFAKPRLRKVNGKRQYVAWAWDDGWTKEFSTSDNYEFDRDPLNLVDEWKHLLLTVHCNPFVEMVTLFNLQEN